jgi:hypothetical protein
VSAIGLDIVFPFGKMSTESDQCQTRSADRLIDGHRRDAMAYELEENPCPYVLTPDLVQHIYEGLRELGYSPYRAGRALRIIGVAYPNVRRVMETVERDRFARGLRHAAFASAPQS